MAQDRKGTAYDPRMVERFCQQASHLLADLEEEPTWEAVLSLEPGARIYLTEAQLDTACQAIVKQGSAGLPVGVQVVARPWREHVALAVMRAIEAVASTCNDYPGIAPV